MAKQVQKDTKKEEKKSLKKEYIFYSIILLVFVVLATIISLKHEYWPDESNAWLIAEDSSLIQLFTKYLHTDGHPALFHLIIKLFAFCGLKYSNFRIISLLFSTLGVAVFLFKSDYKWYLKLLLPFTFFIFYQYTVITRGYCMMLLLLSLLAMLWKKRKEKCILFSFILFLLLSLESYTFIIAGSIYFLNIVDYYLDYRKTKKHDKKNLICLIFIFLAFLLTTIYVFPRPDNTFHPRFTFYYLSDSFITEFTTPEYIKAILSVVTFSILFIVNYKKHDKRQLLELAIIALPIYLFLKFKYCNLWHTGIMFFLLLFIGWIHNYKDSKLFNIFMIITCIIQISWSVNSSIYDYKEVYSPAEDVANFVKKYDYENMKIYAFEFYECSVNAFFDKNIFANWNDDIRFFYWNKSNPYNSISLEPEDLIKDNVDMFIGVPLYQKLDHKKLRESYDEYIFKGSTYFQNHKFENMETYVYVRKGLQQKT